MKKKKEKNVIPEKITENPWTLTIRSQRRIKARRKKHFVPFFMLFLLVVLDKSCSFSKGDLKAVTVSLLRIYKRCNIN